MKKSIMIFLGILLLLFAPVNHVAQQNQGKVISSTHDVGWVTSANSNYTLDISRNFSSSEWASGEFSLHNSWILQAECGASLPINVSVEYPVNVTPGENATINISITPLEGYVFFEVEGAHELQLHIESETQAAIGIVSYMFSLMLQNFYERSWRFNITTPIGNVTQNLTAEFMHAGTFDLALEIIMQTPVGENITHELNVSHGVDVQLLFDVYVVARTKIVATIHVYGTALEEPVNITLEWTSEGTKPIYVPIKPNATEKDSLYIDINVDYVVEEFYIEFSDITMNVTFDKEKLQEGVSNITTEFPGLSEQIIGQINQLFNGTFPIPWNVSETVPLERIQTSSIHIREEDSSTIKSESPYDSTSLLLTQATMSVISIPEAPTEIWRPEIFIVIALVVSAIITIYVIASKRRS